MSVQLFPNDHLLFFSGMIFSFFLAVGEGILLGEDLLLEITLVTTLPGGGPGHLLLIEELELGNLGRIYLLQDLAF